MRETQIKTARRYHLILVRMAIRNFPGGPLVKNQPPNAGDTGWISSLRRFHTQPVQDNYCALALEPVLGDQRSRHKEKPVRCNKDPVQPKINQSIN